MKRSRGSFALAGLAALVLGVAPHAHAQTRENPVRIVVDGSDWARRMLHVQVTLSAHPGPLTLYFPKWIPGTHRPEGNIADLTGIVMRIDGARLPWVRDTLDNHTFHCDVPAGARSLEVNFDALNVPATPEMGFTEWNNLVLYPAGTPVSQLFYRPAFRIPAGWTSATALDSVGTSDSGIEYAIVSLETLVDSPVLAGAYSRRLPLGALFGAPVEANIYCSSPEGLDYKPEFEQKMKAIVREAGALFGARHFDHYRFLIGLGDLQGDITVEHHQSHIYVAPERALLEMGPAPLDLDNIAHEFAHSWCGKYRRPTGLAFTDFQHAENPELLWVYEGFDQYLGYLLNGRSGLMSPEVARMQWIRASLSMANRKGRAWRNIRDAASFSGPLRDAHFAGFTWRRGQDYYIEGALIWLEADATIRRLSGGRKSLDDFCKLFMGGTNTGAQVNPYSEEQVVAALNAIQPFDWKRFLDERVDGLDTPEPARALESAGWRATFADSADEYENAASADNSSGNLAYSLGILASSGGKVGDVVPGGPADRAGIAAGMTILGVDGNTFSKQVMISALKAARTSTQPMELLVTWGTHYRVFQVDCHTGPRYPAGERLPGRADLLSKILHIKEVKGR